VLVVDDDASVRKAVRRLLRSAGYLVEVFAGAGDFLAHPPPLDAGCLVLDIRMPGISGLDLQQQLAMTRPELPIVIITGHGDADLRQRALAGGAVAVLYKPFDDEALLASVARAIAGGAPS
jgi:FixJ family two-component response regulator